MLVVYSTINNLLVQLKKINKLFSFLDGHKFVIVASSVFLGLFVQNQNLLFGQQKKCNIY